MVELKWFWRCNCTVYFLFFIIFSCLFYCLDFSRYSWAALLRALSQPFLLPLPQCCTLLIPAFCHFMCSSWEDLFSVHTESARGFTYSISIYSSFCRGGSHTVHPLYTYSSAVLWGNAIDVSAAASSALCLIFHSAHFPISNHVAQTLFFFQGIWLNFFWILFPPCGVLFNVSIFTILHNCFGFIWCFDIIGCVVLHWWICALF